MNAYLPSAEHVPGGAFAGVRRGPGLSRLRRAATAVAREPLVHFVLLGLVILVASRFFDARATRYTIDVTPAATARLIATYEQQYGSQPSVDQLHTIVDDAIREEIYLREGIDLGLDRNDEIVRRRIAQKFSFLRQDATAPPEPGEADLRAWYVRHAAAYRQPAKRSFDQLYFSIDKVGEDAARRRAAAQLANLAPGASPPLGVADVFPGPSDVRSLSRDEVSRLFGGDAFAQAVFAAPVGRWTGPLRSGFGWHLVRVTEQAPPVQRSFAEAEPDVRRDWTQAQRDARNSADYRHLLARYHVRRADRP